jgi:hypothetical protein
MEKLHLDPKLAILLVLRWMELLVRLSQTRVKLALLLLVLVPDSLMDWMETLARVSQLMEKLALSLLELVPD